MRSWHGNLSPFGQWHTASRAFSPVVLFASNEQGVWLDPSDFTTLFQDTAGTTPVTTPGQSVALALDKSGRGNHATQATAGARPRYALLPSNGLRNLANGSASVGDAAVWGVTFTQSGVTVTKVASGFDIDGLPYVDWQVSGTATATSGLSLYSIGLSRTYATVGQQFTCSVTARLIAGVAPAAGNGVRVEIIGETAPSTVTEFFGSSLSVPATETVLTITGTLANAATNQSRAAPAVAFNNGAVLNFTVRIKALQFERAAARTAYQFNYSNVNIAQPPFAQVGALLFDGVDDFMQTPSIDFSATDKVTVFAGVRKRSDAARGFIVELGATEQNRFRLAGPSGALNDFDFSAGGTSIVGCSSAIAAPFTAVITGAADISADSILQRRNGVQVQTNAADQGTGNFSNAVLYIGRRTGTVFPFNGYLYSLIVRGAATTADQITATENWVNGNTGAY